MARKNPVPDYADVIRGSAADTGALVLRDAQQMMKRGVSVVATTDEPPGPRFKMLPVARPQGRK